MAKFQCTICGQIHEGLEAPEKCPVCKAPSSKFTVIDKGAQKATKLQKINEEDYTNDIIQVVRWYKEKHDLGLKEAKDKVEEVLNDAGLRSVNAKSGSGCMITILIAITSTLSVFFMI